MSEQPIYAPLNVKKNDKIQFFCLNVSGQAEKIIAFIKANTNEKGYVNLQIKEKRQPDQYGNTHSVTLDTWKPTQQRQSEPARNEPAWPKGKSDETSEDNGDSVPF